MPSTNRPESARIHGRAVIRAIPKALLVCTFLVLPLVAGVPAPAVLQGAAQAKPAFEVASVKPSGSDRQGGPYFMPGGRVRALGITLRTLIRIAYSYQRDGVPFTHQVLGGPDWIDEDRFDVEAVSPGGVTDAFGLLRLQALLEQRFGLRLREETRDVPIYVLTPLEGGSRMRSTTGTCVAFTGAPPPPPSPGGAAAEPCGVRGGIGRATGRGVDLPRIARWLSGQPDIGRMVYDRSGGTERYDFDVEWTPGGLRADEAGADTDAARTPSGPGLIAVVERQLGLRLEPTRGPVEVLIIERVARPTPN